MVTMIAADDIDADLDDLAEEYTIRDESIDPIRANIHQLEQDLQSRIDDLEDENDELNSRVEELETSSAFSNFEDFVSALLRSVGSDEPSLGMVLALKDDIKKLLVEKYNISEVNL